MLFRSALVRVPPTRTPEPEPEPVRVVMAHSVEMEEAEDVLSRAMVASITSNRPRVSGAEVSDVLINTFELVDGDFTVHEHHPEDFLILFSSHTTKRRLDGEHFINSPRFSLSLRPWSKLAHAGSGDFEYCVELELRGVPAQAWHLSTAEHVLGTSCWIERLHPRTRSRANLATFKLAARTHHPDNIHRAALLEIVEQIPARLSSDKPSIRILTYPIAIAVARAELASAPVLRGQHGTRQGGEIGRAHV